MKELKYFGTNLMEAGHYMWTLHENRMENNWLRFTGIPFHPEYLTNNLPNGETIFYQGGGFTVFGIVGSPKDTRPGCKSIFWVKDIITRQELIDIILSNKIAMEIIKAMPFTVKF